MTPKQDSVDDFKDTDESEVWGDCHEACDVLKAKLNRLLVEAEKRGELKAFRAFKALEDERKDLLTDGGAYRLIKLLNDAETALKELRSKL